MMKNKKNYNFHDLLEQCALLYPNRVAVQFANNFLTYEALNNKANKLARFLKAHGVSAGKPVGIYVNRCLEQTFPERVCRYRVSVECDWSGWGSRPFLCWARV